MGTVTILDEGEWSTVDRRTAYVSMSSIADIPGVPPERSPWWLECRMRSLGWVSTASCRWMSALSPCQQEYSGRGGGQMVEL